MAANDEGDRPEGEATRLRARDLNELIRYTMWSVFKVTDRAALDGTGAVGEASSSAGLASSVRRDVVADEVTGLLEEAAGKGTTTRGCYDVQGLRADADYMFWWIAPSADDLQEMYARFRRTRLGRASEPVWSVMALHRPAEFNKGHIPAFLADGGAQVLRVRLPVRAVLRVVPAGPGGAPEDARRARRAGPRVPGRPGQHRRPASR